MDERSVNLPVDSASTAKEICQLLSNKVKLEDTFGFSVYVALYEKVRYPTSEHSTCCENLFSHFQKSWNEDVFDLRYNFAECSHSAPAKLRTEPKNK